MGVEGDTAGDVERGVEAVRMAEDVDTAELCRE